MQSSTLTEAVCEQNADKQGLCPSAEDFERMTFQVVLLGNDGLVVGSDRRRSYLTPTINRSPTVQRGLTEKFVKSDDGKVICFFAGGPDAETIATKIASECRPPLGSELQWKSRLQAVAEKCERQRQASDSDEILVVRSDIAGAAWLVLKYQGSGANVTRISEWLCLGDYSPARFLPSHLWSRTSIRELKTLAILTLAYAHEENPSAVSQEFDVMTLDMGGNIEWESPTAGHKAHTMFTECLKKIVGRLASET